MKSRLIRVQMLFTVIITLVMMTYLITQRYFDIETDLKSTSFLLIGGMVALLIVTLYLFLERSNTESTETLSRLSKSEFEDLKKIIRVDFKDVLSNSNINKEEVIELKDEIKNASSNLSKLKDVQFEIKEEHQNEIVEEIKKQIKSGIAAEVVEELNTQYSAFKLKMEFFEKLEEDFHIAKSRLLKELEKLSSRANLNLAIGSGSSLVAIIILGVTVWVKPEQLTQTSDIISYLLPRVSLVIFIEVFAFFFLRLYKTTLGDIKYYQNELTNIDLKLLALKSAVIHQEKEGIVPIITELSKTERNFKIGKDETTIDLERLRHNHQSNQNIMDFMKNYFTNKGKE